MKRTIKEKHTLYPYTLYNLLQMTKLFVYIEWHSINFTFIYLKKKLFFPSVFEVKNYSNANLNLLLKVFLYVYEHFITIVFL